MENKPNDDLNLEPIVNGVLSTGKGIFTALAKFYSIIWNNKVRIGVISFVFASIMVLVTFFIPPVFEVNMSITTTKTGDFFISESVADIAYALEDKNYPAVAKKLNLSAQQSEEISNVELVYADDLALTADTTNKVFLYYITVQVSDQSFLPEMETGFLNYLNNNNFVKKSKVSRDLRQQKLVNGIDEDLAKVDSILKLVTTAKYLAKDKSTFILKDPIDPAEILKERNRLLHLKAEYEESLMYGNDIQLFQGFDTQIKPYFPKKSWSAIAGALLGFIVSLLSIRNKKRSV